MKGQVSYIMKPMMLIAVVILLVFLLQSLYSSGGKERMAEKNLDIVGTATNVLLILSNSEGCLAYNDQTTEITKANILDVNKLDYFSEEYENIEPECTRNYEFGWRVDVKQIDKNNQAEKEWSFGAKEFSKGKSLNNEVEFWIPVAIRYSNDDVKLGKMEITFVDGELEKLAGFFDWSCRMGQLNRMSSLSTDIKISQSVNYENGELCIGGSCRELLCDLVYFEGFDLKGSYTLTVNYQEPNRLLVGK